MQQNSVHFSVTLHFKCAMNTIMWGSLQYPSNVNYLNFEHESLRGSSNLHNNFQLNLTWKLKAISPQQNTFQKPRNQVSVFHLHKSSKYGYTSGLKNSAIKFLADHLNFVLLQCTRCLATISHHEVLSLNAHPHSVNIKTSFSQHQNCLLAQPASC